MIDQSKIDISRVLANKVLALKNLSIFDYEQKCWQIVHEYRHGVLPSEYDIREIDEELFLLVLDEVRKRKTN